MTLFCAAATRKKNIRVTRFFRFARRPRVRDRESAPVPLSQADWNRALLALEVRAANTYYHMKKDTEIYPAQFAQNKMARLVGVRRDGIHLAQSVFEFCNTTEGLRECSGWAVGPTSRVLRLRSRGSFTTRIHREHVGDWTLEPRDI